MLSECKFNDASYACRNFPINTITIISARESKMQKHVTYHLIYLACSRWASIHCFISHNRDAAKIAAIRRLRWKMAIFPSIQTMQSRMICLNYIKSEWERTYRFTATGTYSHVYIYASCSRRLFHRNNIKFYKYLQAIRVQQYEQSSSYLIRSPVRNDAAMYVAEGDKRPPYRQAVGKRAHHANERNG